MTSILVIGDSHAKAGVPNDRYDWLGRMIADLKPDEVVDIGDFGDFAALCSYTMGTLAHYDRDFFADMEAAHDARNRVMQPIKALQAQNRRNKEKVYKPKLVYCTGNHSQPRLKKWLNQHPYMLGFVNKYAQDLTGAIKHGWDVIDFGEVYNSHGVQFSHYFTSGAMGKPIGGVNPAYAVAQKKKISSVFGHDHRKSDYTELHNGRSIVCAGVGCYFEHWEDYAGQSNHEWWRGIRVLKNVENGYFTTNDFSMDEIKHNWGTV